MNDSVFDLENYISQEFARRIGAAEEESFLTGDGNKKPEGVFTKVTATDGALTTINDAKAINQVVQCSDSMLEILKDNMEAVIGEETEKNWIVLHPNLRCSRRRFLKQHVKKAIRRHCR